MKTIDIHLPTSWQELTDKQLKYYFKLLVAELSATEIRTLCLVKWADLRIIRYMGEFVLCKFGRKHINVSTDQIADIVHTLDWLDEIPASPVRFGKIGKFEALPAKFEGVPFESYLAAENLYQGYLLTKDDSLLDELARILYQSDTVKVKDFQRMSIFYWLTSLRNYFANKFPNFLRPATNATSGKLLGAAPNVIESMNVQIRALTKGDVTKEAQVLAMDTWRALTELDAQAKEYEEINRKYGNQQQQL